MKYRVTVITDGISCTASRPCGKSEAENICRRLSETLLGSTVAVVEA